MRANLSKIFWPFWKRYLKGIVANVILKKFQEGKKMLLKLIESVKVRMRTQQLEILRFGAAPYWCNQIGKGSMCLVPQCDQQLQIANSCLFLATHLPIFLLVLVILCFVQQRSLESFYLEYNSCYIKVLRCPHSLKWNRGLRGLSLLENSVDFKPSWKLLTFSNSSVI